MQQIPITAVANQKLTIQLEQVRYDITVKSIPFISTCTIVRDGVTVVDNIRCLANQPLLPFQSQENQSGNFIWITQNEDYPEYTQFGITQFLLYITATEMAAFRGSI